ncbi:winged helix-turn-helix domain-containing tetratricopeptide repeat protein [Falsiroseomonas sp. E2-1-a20]|uniref:winged helix-turn-helix domain-containing tetratricopeptide repeat protein n=1 Tax=Falsiroseomonas sp. E2-1-a20 TaxID=3239300 RepID=UPI003F37D2ED
MDKIAEDKVLHFAGVILDGVRGCLLGEDGVEVPLAPKPFDLLMVLAHNAGRTMSKDALLDAAWPGVHVTEDSLFRAVREARRAIGDEAGRILRSVPRRGYLLDTAVSAGTAPGLEITPAAKSPLVPPTDRPSLVVLPFQNMSGDPDQAYFADGMVEEITSALSRIRWLFVIARNTAFTYGGRAVDVREVGHALGVRYVLEGSVRKAGGQVRIGCQLVEAATGHHVWTERFDGDIADVFALQDRVAEAVAGAIEPSLRLAEVERARRKPTESLDAYDFYLRALPHHYAKTQVDNDTCLALLRRAIALDPRFSLAKAFAAFSLLQQEIQGWSSPDERDEGIRLAREALSDAQDDPATLRCAGQAVAWLAQDRAGGWAALDRALALNPNSAQVLGSAAWILNYLGEAERAVVMFHRAIRLSPLDPEMAFFLSGLGFAALMLCRYEEALVAGTQSIPLQPGRATGHRVVVGALHALGRLDEARAAARRYQAANPAGARVFADRIRWLFADDHFTLALIQALRDAGLPE